MLATLPPELLVHVLALIVAAADFARAAASCVACRDALEQAVRAHVLGRGLPSSHARPWLRLSPFVRIRMPWAFLLRIEEVRPRVLEALGPHPTRAVHEWFYGKHDAPTAWCIANEQQIIDNARLAEAEERARAEKAAALAAEEARKRARAQAAREQTHARMAARRMAKISIGKMSNASSDSESESEGGSK